LYDWLNPDGGLYSNFTLDMDFELYTMQSSSVDAEVYSVLREGN